MADVKKLREVLKTIKEVEKLRQNPRSRKFKGLYWDQGDWLQPVSDSEKYEDDKTVEVCGTAMCFAGWTLYLDGFTKVDRDAWMMVNPENGDTVEIDMISTVAAERLDLEYGEADRLFAGGNDIDHLAAIINDIHAGRIPSYPDDLDDD